MAGCICATCADSSLRAAVSLEWLVDSAIVGERSWVRATASLVTLLVGDRGLVLPRSRHILETALLLSLIVQGHANRLADGRTTCLVVWGRRSSVLFEGTTARVIDDLLKALSCPFSTVGRLVATTLVCLLLSFESNLLSKLLEHLKVVFQVELVLDHFLKQSVELAS